MVSLKKISTFTTLLAIFVVIAFPKQSEASVDPKYQVDVDEFDQKALAGGNVIIELALRAMDEITNITEKAKADGAFPEAVDVLKDGLFLTIKLININGDHASDLVTKYCDNDVIDDVEGTINYIESQIKKFKNGIYRAGVPVLSAMGASAVITPCSVQSINDAMYPLQDSGTAIFNSMDAAQALLTRAIKTSKYSRENYIRIAEKNLISGTSALNSDFVRAAKNVFPYLSDVANGRRNDFTVSGDKHRNRALAIASDTVTITIIRTVELSFVLAKKQQLPCNVVNKIREGIMGYIAEAVKGFARVVNCLLAAKNLPNSEKQKALKMVYDGKDAVKGSCINGSVLAYSGFGGAARLMKNSNAFSDAIEVIENSRIDTTDDIDAAMKSAVMGIIAEGDAKKQGLCASLDAMDVIQYELLSRIVKAEALALKELQILPPPPQITPTPLATRIVWTPVIVPRPLPKPTCKQQTGLDLDLGLGLNLNALGLSLNLT